jgi:hypothetical protein
MMSRGSVQPAWFDTKHQRNTNKSDQQQEERDGSLSWNNCIRSFGGLSSLQEDVDHGGDD